jgi:hypothetical protein
MERGVNNRSAVGVRRGVLGAAVVLVVVSACTSEPPAPITFTGSQVTVENQTPDQWRDVEIWVNDHYRVTRASMPPGERFAVPLDAFVAGFGQRFNPKRQVVQGVEVTARTGSGAPVRIVWGRGRRQ